LPLPTRYEVQGPEVSENVPEVSSAAITRISRSPFDVLDRAGTINEVTALLERAEVNPVTLRMVSDGGIGAVGTK